MQRIKLSATESTSTYLKGLMATNSLSDFTVVSTLNQTQGRGQAHNAWESESGKNLTFSMLKYFEDFEVQHGFCLSMCVSLAIYEALTVLGIPRLSVKWPNDILTGNKKLCGILIENSLMGHAIKSSVIGIGLNVNQCVFQEPKASSLQLVLEKSLVLEQVLEIILEKLHYYLSTMVVGSEAVIKATYERLLYKKDVPATFIEPKGSAFMGRITGVSDEGKLRITLADDSHMVYNLKEVKMLY